MTENTAILRNIDEQHLTLVIDGEVQEIKHQLVELKQLLSEKQVQNIQYADKIYNIEHIDNANFGFVTGRKAFNEHLAKQIIDALQTRSVFAKRLLKEAANKADWEKSKKYRNPAKKIIADSFVGVIGVGLSQLMAIGDETVSKQSEYDKENAYIEKCIQIVEYSLALVNFTLLCKLWDKQKSKEDYILDEATQAKVSERLKSNFPPSLQERLALLRHLHATFLKLELDFPIKELAAFSEQLKAASDFEQLINQFKDIKAKLEQGQYNLLNCFEAERSLTDFLLHFIFLSNYNMASIKRIGYREVRNDSPAYFHRYNALGIDLKSNVDAEKGLYTPATAPTNAVLFYEGDNYKDNISLFPFVIDYNSLTLEQGTQIGFFQSRNLADASLDYFILMKDKVENIAKKDVFDAEKDDLGMFLLSDEQHIAFNLDGVVDNLEQAQSELCHSLDIENC